MNKCLGRLLAQPLRLYYGLKVRSRLHRSMCSLPAAHWYVLTSLFDLCNQGGKNKYLRTCLSNAKLHSPHAWLKLEQFGWILTAADRKLTTRAAILEMIWPSHHDLALVKVTQILPLDIFPAFNISFEDKMFTMYPTYWQVSMIMRYCALFCQRSKWLAYLPLSNIAKNLKWHFLCQKGRKVSFLLIL